MSHDHINPQILAKSESDWLPKMTNPRIFQSTFWLSIPDKVYHKTQIKKIIKKTIYFITVLLSIKPITLIYHSIHIPISLMHTEILSFNSFSFFSNKTTFSSWWGTFHTTLNLMYIVWENIFIQKLWKEITVCYSTK